MNLIFNFTGIYEEEGLTGDPRFHTIDCTSMNGVTGYCSEESMRELAALIKPFGISGLHFLDSGNYHYLTRLFLGEIREPFHLLVFDNHTDAGLPSFSGIPISCGSWIRHALETLPNLRRVTLIGPSAERLRESRDVLESTPGRVFALSAEDLLSGHPLLPPDPEKLPIYLSLDKDVFPENVCRTNWDQGILTPGQLKELTGQILSGRKLLGADICGEFPREGNIFPSPEDVRKNRELNRELAGYLLSLS